MHNLEIIDKSKLVARWSNNHDFIEAQINGKIKYVIYE